MKISIIYYATGIVILHFIHGSETLKNVSVGKKISGSVEETVTRQPRYTNDINIKRKYVKNVQPNLNEKSVNRPGSRQILYSDRFPLSDHRHMTHQPRLKPILRRRYQINTNSIQNQGYPKTIQKMYTQLSPNYPIKNYPMKKYYKSPQYHQKLAHLNPHQRHNIHRISPKFSQNHFNTDGINDLKSSYSHLNKGLLPFGSKGFHASPPFNGNVIVRPSAHHKHNQQHHHNEQKQQYDDDYHYTTKSYPSYAVYDDTSEDITQKPIQYHVHIKNPVSENDQQEDHLKSTQQNEETEKYLSFMTSRDYFLPKQQPDYHIRTGLTSSSNSGVTNNPQHVKETYMNVKTNLDFRPQQYPSSNNFGTNTYHHKTKDWYDSEKLEFTENDAIHSSLASNPEEELAVDDLKLNYSNNNQKFGTPVFNVASLTAAGNKNNNEKEKWSTPITDITKRKDIFLIKSMSDEQISKECAKKCFSETDVRAQTGEMSGRNERKIDANLGFNDSELDCYESCINTYASGGQN